MCADTAAAASTEREHAGQRSVVETQAIVHHSYDNLIDTLPALATPSTHHHTHATAAANRHPSLSSSTRFSSLLCLVLVLLVSHCVAVCDNCTSRQQRVRSVFIQELLLFLCHWLGDSVALAISCAVLYPLLVFLYYFC